MVSIGLTRLSVLPSSCGWLALLPISGGWLALLSSCCGWLACWLAKVAASGFGCKLLTLFREVLHSWHLLVGDWLTSVDFRSREFFSVIAKSLVLGCAVSASEASAAPSASEAPETLSPSGATEAPSASFNAVYKSQRSRYLQSSLLV